MGQRKKWLFDCDGVLVLSEQLAFEACCGVVNATLSHKGVETQFTPAALVERFVGCAFRRMITELAQEHSFPLGDQELEDLVRQEEDCVVARLEAEVEPTPGVNNILAKLHHANGNGRSNGNGHGLAVVSSSALRRVRACLRRAGQDGFFNPEHIFSAVALPGKQTKPHPAVYLHALGVLGDGCEAIEDSRSGVLAAVAAKIPCLGYVGSYPPAEQDRQSEVLLAAGAFRVIRHWDEFVL